MTNVQLVLNVLLIPFVTKQEFVQQYSLLEHIVEPPITLIVHQILIVHNKWEKVLTSVPNFIQFQLMSLYLLLLLLEQLQVQILLQYNNKLCHQCVNLLLIMQAQINVTQPGKLLLVDGQKIVPLILNALVFGEQPINVIVNQTHKDGCIVKDLWEII